jgi:hypothetical protein
LRFAIKCGGSAKKIQLSNTEAITIKKPPKTKDDRDASYNKSISKNLDCKKCEEILRNEMLENLTTDNAIVCKHDSASNLSILNPGLLIVEKENTDAQNALMNAHVLPHSHLNITHQQAKNLYYNQSQLKPTHKKTGKSMGFERINQNLDTNNNEFLLKSSNHEEEDRHQHLQYQLERQLRHEQRLQMKHSHKSKNNHNNAQQFKMHKIEAQNMKSSLDNGGEVLNVFDDESNEHQLNFDKYLSKSKISNQSSNRY